MPPVFRRNIMRAGIAQQFEEFNRAIETAKPLEPGLLETFVKTVVNGLADRRPIAGNAGLDRISSNAVAGCVEQIANRISAQHGVSTLRERSPMRWKASFQREIARLI